MKRLIKLYKMKQDPIGYSRSIGVKIGDRCRIYALTDSTFGSEPFLVSLGDHVTVTSDVKFITHDGGVWVFREQHPDIDVFGPIRVGNNVFIGVNSIIMPGVTIGDNCVIGAGAVVTRDIPSGSVAVGMPAKVIGTVEDYWAKVEKKATHIRSMNHDQKKEYLINTFMK